MGNVDESKIHSVKKDIAGFYRLDVKILPKIKVIKRAKILGTEKYGAYEILDHINLNYKNIDGKILILTNVDICAERTPNKLTKNTLGLAYVNSKPCVVSTKKINSKEKLSKISIHELGHTFGLRHCKNPKCVMSTPNSITGSEKTNKVWMCNKCKKEIF